MAEQLEGILSESILDKLASDLGVDPDDMRKHPFFRVLKGRVLLTYPLRVGETIFSPMEPAKISQQNPDNETWITILDTTEKGRLKYIKVLHTFTEARKIRVRITIDGRLIEIGVGGLDQTEGQDWYIYRTYSWAGTEALTGSTDVNMVELQTSLEGKKVKVEIQTLELIDGDAWLRASVYYDQVV